MNKRSFTIFILILILPIFFFASCEPAKKRAQVKPNEVDDAKGFGYTKEDIKEKGEVAKNKLDETGLAKDSEDEKSDLKQNKKDKAGLDQTNVKVDDDTKDGIKDSKENSKKVSEGNDKSTTEVSDKSEIDYDFEIGEKVFLEQINDIYFYFEDYADKKIAVEGMYSNFTNYDGTKRLPVVYRYGPGCCGNDGWGGFMLSYDKPFPNENDWIRVIGTPYLEEDEFGGLLLYLKVLSLEVKTERGNEYVTH